MQLNYREHAVGRKRSSAPSPLRRWHAPPPITCSEHKRSASANSASTAPYEHALRILKESVGALATSAAASALSLALLLPCPAQAAELTFRFKASANPEIRAAQQTLVESWAYVSTSYLDPTFNGKDWDKALRASLDESFTATDKAGVYKLISKMLKQLDDPFTRFLPPADAQTFEDQREGKVQATGLGVGQDSSGRFIVAFVADKSPAQAAGVLVGDELVAVNGEALTAGNVQRLSRYFGKEIDIKLKRSSEVVAALAAAEAAAAAAAPPAAADLPPLLIAPTDATVAMLPAVPPPAPPPPPPPAYPTSSYISLHLSPAPVDYEPVQYAMLPSRPSAPKLGYIRVVAFTEGSAGLVEQAVRALAGQGAQGLVLDMRDNPGGVVSEGIEVAKDFLKDGDVFCYAYTRTGEEEEARLQDTHTLTQVPLAVLLNGGSASTSELLAAALHDNRSALLVGERSFGKGRTQRVIDLTDGSTLLVSTMSYRTPAHMVVHKVGLAPDVVCRAQPVGSELWQAGSVSGGSLLDDPCVELAARKLSRQAS